MATTTKPVNLYQLGQEVGGDPSFHAIGPLHEDGPEKRITSPDVDDDTLQSALEGHTADWSVAPEQVEDEQTLADREFRAAVEGATSIADLKAALLGTSSKGRAAVRPTR